jgi:hypothetical protein
MLKRFLRITFGLILAFTVLVRGIRALPFDDPLVEIFTTAPEFCNGLCVLDIVPNITTVGESMSILENHTWVTNIRRNAGGLGYAEILWDWTGQQPQWIDSSHGGQVTFFWISRDSSNQELINEVLIQTVTVYTEISMYSLIQWYGIPHTSFGGTQFSESGADLVYSAMYNMPRGSVKLSTNMACPATLLSYNVALARFTLTIERGAGEVNSPMDIINSC